MLDSKIQQLKDHFGIAVDTDWQSVKPEWIVSQDGIGQATLDYLRLLLAARGLTLKDDRTPEFWQKHLKQTRITHTLGNEMLDDNEGIDRGIVTPFTVLIDTAEQHPFTFQGLRADGAKSASGSRPLIVPTESRSLGRHPDSLGDYSIDSPIGGFGRCHVERKSMEDAHGTILGWKRKGEDTGRRERFECELENLSNIEAGLVIVECSFTELIAKAPVTTNKTASQNAKALFRSVLAYQQDYAVKWQFCDDRRMAEQMTFRWLERWYRKQVEGRKEVERETSRASRANRERAADEKPQSVEAELAAL